MKVLGKENQVVGQVQCNLCGSKLEVSRSDLRIEYGGLFGLREIPYITCPVCETKWTVPDKELYRFGLQRG